MSTTGLARHRDELQLLAAHGRTVGHDHFWERAVSRRVALKLTGGAFATALALPALARAGSKTTSADPRPIPPSPDFGGLHIQPPAEGFDVSTIYDFNGIAGASELRGTGTLTMSGTVSQAFFDVDNRFMSGEYIGLDGQNHHGTFGFI